MPRLTGLRDPREGGVLELLARRYARGEIDRQEFLQKQSDILSYPGMAATTLRARQRHNRLNATPL